MGLLIYFCWLMERVCVGWLFRIKWILSFILRKIFGLQKALIEAGFRTLLRTFGAFLLHYVQWGKNPTLMIQIKLQHFFLIHNFAHEIY